MFCLVIENVDETPCYMGLNEMMKISSAFDLRSEINCIFKFVNAMVVQLCLTGGQHHFYRHIPYHISIINTENKYFDVTQQVKFIKSNWVLLDILLM